MIAFLFGCYGLRANPDRKEEATVTHLRFTPAEYHAICHACRGLAALAPAAFRRLLAAALAVRSPALAGRVAGLTGGEALLLQQHLRGGAGPGKGATFTAEELETLAELCGSVPDSVRFAAPFQRLLVRCLRPYSPGLARKLGRLRVTQFERLYEQVRGRRPDDA